MTRYRKARDVNGNEVTIVDDQHLKDILFRWVTSIGVGYLIAATVWAINVQQNVVMATRDIRDLKEIRREENNRLEDYQDAVIALQKSLDSVRITFSDVRVSMSDFGEDLRSLRRELRRPR